MTLRALIANEAGDGRGHVTKLDRIGRLLAAEGVQVGAALARMTHAAELASAAGRVIAAPPLRWNPAHRSDPDAEGNATFGDYLAAMGLARGDVLRRGLAFWRQAIVRSDASILVADYAPLAQRAALGLRDEGWDIAIVVTGTGYGVPPGQLPVFPRLLPDWGRSVRDEAETLATLNRVAAEGGLDPLPALPALYACDLAMPATFAFLDPYDGMRPDGARLFPPVPDLPPLSDGTGDEVFVYLSTDELADDRLFQALRDLGLPRRGYLPGTPPDRLAELAASGMIVEAAPLPWAAISARSRLILHAAQHGSICHAAMAGVPQVGLPQHMEQVFHGFRAAWAGILRKTGQRRGAGPLADEIRSAYADAAFGQGARDFAHHLRASHPPEAAHAQRDALAALVAEVRARGE
ncbi:MAG TPA: hypothetical protein PKD10_18075 [Paracoccaceae bacterium]|nr:hypothetical protein [Paracoccaceae bacterium]HMO73325.1 hypothetical protein [Paracoccaceae bacterium]